MRKLIFPALTFFSFCPAAAQEELEMRSRALFIGAGNYEYLHAGAYAEIRKKHYVELGLGIKPWGFSSSTYQAVYLLAGTRLLPKRSFFLTPSVHLKCLAWHYNNRYNEFLVLGINPELRLSLKIKNNYSLSLNGGVLYNRLLRYELKTYEEVGQPKTWQPSFSLQLFYFIK